MDHIVASKKSITKQPVIFTVLLKAKEAIIAILEEVILWSHFEPVILNLQLKGRINANTFTRCGIVALGFL